MSVADNYGPSSKVINVAVKEFIDEAANKGVTLSEDVAKNMVNEVWANAKLPRGVMMNEGTKSGVVRLGSVPNFFLKSSNADRGTIIDLTVSNTDCLNNVQYDCFNDGVDPPLASIFEAVGISKEALSRSSPTAILPKTPSRSRTSPILRTARWGGIFLFCGF